MAHRQQNSNFGKAATKAADTYLAINDNLFGAVRREATSTETLLPIDNPTVNSTTNEEFELQPTNKGVQKIQINRDLSEHTIFDVCESIADTTKMIEDDSDDCSRTVLVDTKALNRQKELDERYGG